jgi:hypothetical protein
MGWLDGRAMEALSEMLHDVFEVLWHPTSFAATSPQGKSFEPHVRRQSASFVSCGMLSLE